MKVVQRRVNEVDKGATLRVVKADTLPRIGLKTMEGIRVLDSRNILCLEACGNYCNVHVRGLEKPLMVSKTLKYVSAALSGSKFMRVHKSYLVRGDAIEFVGETITLENGMTVPVSRRSRADIVRAISENLIIV